MLLLKFALLSISVCAAAAAAIAATIAGSSSEVVLLGEEGSMKGEDNCLEAERECDLDLLFLFDFLLFLLGGVLSDLVTSSVSDVDVDDEEDVVVVVVGWSWSSVLLLSNSSFPSALLLDSLLDVEADSELSSPLSSP